MLDLAIVIVNYNVRELLRRCLHSVFASRGDLRFAVCVVDNNSHDGSVAMVRHDFPQAFVISNQENYGYPAANNQGLRAFGVEGEQPPRYCLLLNPDTELSPCALMDMVDYLDNHPDIAVAGPKVVLPDGKLDRACRRGFPTPASSFYYMVGLDRLFPGSRRIGHYNMTYLGEDEIAEVDSVVGAFMMVRTEAIRQVGYLDEAFWMYGEDLDWAKRIKDAGWKVIYNPEVTIRHVKRASSRQNPRAQSEFVRAFLIFYYKHYYRETPIWLHWPVLLGIAAKGGREIWPLIKLGPDILRLAAQRRGLAPPVSLKIPPTLQPEA